MVKNAGFSRINQVARLLSLAALGWAGAAHAQPTTTSFTLRLNVTLSDNFFIGTGTVSPFGTAAISVALGQQPIPFVITFFDGDKLVAEITQFIGGTDQGNGSGNITGGTGAFDGATGQLAFSFALGTNASGTGWGLQATGTVTTTAPVTTNLPPPPTPGYQQIDCGNLSGVPVTQPALLPGSAVRPGGVTPKLGGALLAAYYILCPPGASLLTIPQQAPEQDVTQDAPGKQQAEQMENNMVQTAGGGKETSSSPPDSTLDYNLTNVLPYLGGLSLPIRNAATVASSAPTATLYYVPPVSTTAANYMAAVTCADTSASCWATMPAPAGTIPANSLGAIPVTVSPAGLAAGTYKAMVSITSDGTTKTATISLAVNPNVPAFFLSNTGLQMQAVSGVPGMQSATLSVVSQPDNSATFSATASTLTGANWLTVSPSSGNLAAASSAQVAIQANPAGLAPGIYYGAVDFAGQGSATQRVQVGLTVTAASAAAAPVMAPTGLVFVTTAGSNPAAQKIQIANRGSQPLTINTQAAFGSTAAWFTAAPASQNVTSGQPLTETITVNAQGLAAGSYLATLSVSAAGSNTTFPVEVLLIVQPAAGVPTCTPTQCSRCSPISPTSSA